MATRGVFQLQKLSIYYCEYGGSSRAVRDYLESGKIVEWASRRPTVDVAVKVRNGKHPHVKAEYLTHNKGSAGHHQICLKSNKSHVPDVESVMDKLYNRSGRKITKFTKTIYTATPSIQGVWTPALNLHLTPEFQMKVVEGSSPKHAGGESAETS